MADPYHPHKLLNAAKAQLGLKSDAALARMLAIAPPTLSKVRHCRMPVGPSLLIRLHDITGMSTRQMRTLMGDRRNIFRMAHTHGEYVRRADPSLAPSACTPAGAGS